MSCELRIPSVTQVGLGTWSVTNGNQFTSITMPNAGMVGIQINATLEGGTASGVFKIFFNSSPGCFNFHFSTDVDVSKCNIRC